MQTPIKRCPKCQRELPATTEYFPPRKSSADGFRHECRECNRARLQAWRDQKQSDLQSGTYQPTVKTCAICGNTYPATTEFFNHTRGQKDGLNSYCVNCRKSKRKTDYQNNPDERAKAQKRSTDWYYANYERASESRKRVYWSNPEKARQASKSWADNNREYKRKRDIEYHKTRYYPKKREEYRVWVRNRRARLRKAQGSHTVEDITRIYQEQEGTCFYCGVELNKTFAVDHVVPLNLGGWNSPDNLVVVCKSCNSSKGDRTPDDWRQNPLIPKY